MGARFEEYKRTAFQMGRARASDMYHYGGCTRDAMREYCRRHVEWSLSGLEMVIANYRYILPRLQQELIQAALAGGDSFINEKMGPEQKELE